MGDKIHRRLFLGGGAGMGAWLSGAADQPQVRAAEAGAGGCLDPGASTFGHTMLFMEEYHQATVEILGRLSGELDQVGELSSRAAAVIKSGGTVWTSMDDGHMPREEQKASRRGNPGILRNHNGFKPATFDAMQKGDMVFTNQCNRAVQRARDRGVYVVAVTVNYVDNEFRPAGFTNPNEDDLMLKDVSNEILHSHVPYYQGLVHAPQIPEFTLCPSTTTGSGALHWMLTAEVADKVWTGSTRSVDKSAEYLRVLTERVDRIRQHQPRIQETAVSMARRIRRGGRWFARSLEHPGFASELSGVASGPMIINWGDWEATRELNVMIISAISPAHVPEMRLAREKQIEGAYVIGVGPGSMDGEVPPGRLIDVADAGFDNFSPERDGVIEIAGRKGRICPTSGIVGNVIQQMICAQWTDEMVRRGSVPYYWMGFFQAGGRPYDDAMRPHFEAQGF